MRYTGIAGNRQLRGRITVMPFTGPEKRLFAVEGPWGVRSVDTRLAIT